MRRLIPYLFLAAAVCSVGAALTAKCPNGRRIVASFLHLAIAFVYLHLHLFARAWVSLI